MPGPRAVRNLEMPQPQDWQGRQMPRSNLGGWGGAWAQLELTDAYFFPTSTPVTTFIGEYLHLPPPPVHSWYGQ